MARQVSRSLRYGDIRLATHIRPASANSFATSPEIVQGATENLIFSYSPHHPFEFDIIIQLYTFLRAKMLAQLLIPRGDKKFDIQHASLDY